MQNLRAASVGLLLGTIAATVPSPAAAQVDLRALASARPTATVPETGQGLWGRRILPALVKAPDGAALRAAGLTAIGSWSAVRAPLPDLLALQAAHPDWQVSWSPPLRPLLDRAGTWTAAPAFRNETGLTGSGVVVGVVDTGADFRHEDLRRADGGSRILYFIDFGQQPRGVHPEAEDVCKGMALSCAVFGRAELDELIGLGSEGDVPRDVVGHGTHVASLAAGNGGPDGKYVGIAPEADIVVARALDANGDITDSAVLASTNLVFWLADREARARGVERVPAVVNLSLGSDFGPHDGTSSLEQGLAELVGPDQPGRAIVVSAGNSAGMFSGLHPDFPQPMGIHTEVHVPGKASVRVPLVAFPSARSGTSLQAAIYAWISYRPGDDLLVGVDRRSGQWVSPRPRGTASSFVSKDGGVTATIVNGALSRLRGNLSDGDGAVVVLEGKWPADETFAIRFEGRGTASLWVQPEGDLSPSSGALGVLFPAATKESTTTIPAGHPELVAVGATVNRTSWIDRTGTEQRVATFGGRTEGVLDGVGFFSSAGPTSDLRMKPDLLAPGAFVVGAMGRDATPQRSPVSMFAEGGHCQPVESCSVVDATHGLATGTSMAAPLVAGALALLFAQDPSLTSAEALTLLQAGARRPEGVTPLDAQLGPGALSLTGTLDVVRQLAAREVRTIDAKRSWLTLAQGYAHPDPSWTLESVLQLRDAEGRPADSAVEELGVTVANGRVVQPLERRAPGYFRFAVAADAGAGGATLDVQVARGGRVVARATVPVAVDVNVAKAGFSTRGGCSTRPGNAGNDAGVGALVVLGALVTAARAGRRSRAARTARSPGRTGTSDRCRRAASRR